MCCPNFRKTLGTSQLSPKTKEWVSAGYGMAQTRAFLEVIEKEPRVALGIYMTPGSGDLYLLARTNGVFPGLGKGRQWWAVRLDPRTGAEVGRTLLPSASGHLTVVPGRDNWTLVEKDEVERVFVNRAVGDGSLSENVDDDGCANTYSSRDDNTGLGKEPPLGPLFLHTRCEALAPSTNTLRVVDRSLVDRTTGTRA